MSDVPVGGGVLHQVATALSPPPPRAAAMGYDGVHDLARVREFVCVHASAAGLPHERVAALRLAVSEVATNTLRHTCAGGIVRVWSADGTVICEVTDFGTFAALKSHRAPDPGVPGGWGLEIAAEVCDAFYCFSRPGRTVWRLVAHG